MSEKEKYKKNLIESGLFFYGINKGSFILPPHGYSCWKNIQKYLDEKFKMRGVQNVLLPTLIPLDLLEKEKEHIAKLSLECFYVERIGEKKIEVPLVLRPTSELLFAKWYQQILKTYKELPLLYNQWCQVFRAEKNPSPFFRNNEFLWQEGHTLHESSEEARQFTQDIWIDYQDYAENVLSLGIIKGQKSNEEKFAGALETYTVECLLPDGQCLQLATSHYFGNKLCRLMNIKFQNKKNKFDYPFSTSWGTSTRALGAIAKTHNDEQGLILPFGIAPIQVAFVLVKEEKELIDYYRKILAYLEPYFRCKLYQNVWQADKEGCSLKIIIGPEELRREEITLIRRDDIKKKVTISLKKEAIFEKHYLSILEDFAEKISKISTGSEKVDSVMIGKKMIEEIKKGERQGKIFKNIIQMGRDLNENIYQKSIDFINRHTFSIKEYQELKEKIERGVIGLFLIPFCNNLECEKTIKNKVPAYSIRCLKENQDINSYPCLFCNTLTNLWAYLGRSY